MGHNRGTAALRRALMAVVTLGVAASLAAVVPATSATASDFQDVAASRPTDRQLAADQPRLPRGCAKPPAPVKGCRLVWHGAQAPTLVLWGDSHMWMMSPAVKRAAAGKRVNLVLFYQGGCIPSLPDRSIYAGNDCAEVQYSAMRYLQQLKASGRPYRLLLGSFWGANLNRLYWQPRDRVAISEERRRYALRYTPPVFRWLGNKGIPTDVTYQGPAAGPPARCALGTSPFWCSTTRYRAYFKDTYVRGWLGQRMRDLSGRNRLVDYSDAVCRNRSCPAVVNGVHTWFDAYHLSKTKATSLASYFRPTVKATTRRR